MLAFLTTLLFILDLILHIVMAGGTIYTAWRLDTIRRDIPSHARLLLLSGDESQKNAAMTLHRFSEVRLLEMALLFQAGALLSLGVGFALGYDTLQTFIMWCSLTGAAGGAPIILTVNGRTWVGEIRQQKALRARLLPILGDGYDDAILPLMGELHADPDAVHKALKALKEDGLVELGPKGRYVRTEDGDKLFNLLHGENGPVSSAQRG